MSYCLCILWLFFAHNRKLFSEITEFSQVNTSEIKLSPSNEITSSQDSQNSSAEPPPLEIFTSSKGHGVEVRFSVPELTAIQPGQIVTTSACITNHTNQEQTINTNLILPEDWSAIPDEHLSMTLAPQEQQIQLIAFVVPKQASAGAHKITLEAVCETKAELRDQDETSVSIAPKTQLDAFIEKKPKSVQSGDSYEIIVNYLNKGNTTLDCQVIATIYPEQKMTATPSEFTLLPGERKTFSLVVKTDIYLSTSNNSVLLKVIEKSTQETLQATSFGIGITTKESFITKKYYEVPSSVRVESVMENDSRITVTEVAGRGIISPRSPVVMEYCARYIPDYNINQLVNGEYERYFLGFSSPTDKIQLGDDSYSLSYLTQQYRYARGAGLWYNPGPFDAGFFFNKNIFPSNDGKQQTFGLRLGRMVGEHVDFGAHMLKGRKFIDPLTLKVKEIQLMSVQADYTPEKKGVASVEIAKDCKTTLAKEDRSAYRCYARGLTDERIGFSLEKTRAGSGYWGFVHDSDLLAGSLTVPYGLKWTTSANASSLKQNLHPTQNPSSATRQKQANLACTYTPWQSFLCTLEGFDYRTKDVSPISQGPNFRQQWILPKAGVSFSRFSLQVQLGRGRNKDYQFHTKLNNLKKGSIYGSLTLSQNLTYAVSYDRGNLDLFQPLNKRTQLSNVISYRFSHASLIQLTFQRNTISPPGQPRSIQKQFLGQFTHIFPNKHVLTALVQYSTSKSVPASTTPATPYHLFRIGYIIPFGLPAGKNTDLGELSGMVYDAMTNQPIDNAILNLHGNRTNTDPRGFYSFPAIRPGAYNLTTELLPNNLVTQDKSYIPVTIRGGEKTTQKISVVAPALVKGSIIIQKQKKRAPRISSQSTSIENESQKSIEPEINQEEEQEEFTEQPYANARVVIRRQDFSEILSQLTDKNGQFEFYGLRPGTWIVSVFLDTLPEGYHFEKSEETITVQSSEIRTLQFFVRQKVRIIQPLE